MASADTIKGIVNNYINSDISRYAILLDGGWGEGKTYFVEQELTEYLSNYQVDCRHISLFGMSAKSDIEDALVGALSTLESSPLKKAFDDAGKAISGNATDDVKISGSAFGALLNSAFYLARQHQLKKVEKAASDDEKKMLFVFDDLERFLGDIAIPMAFISRMIEQMGAKVLVICNKAKFLSNNGSEEAVKQFVLFTEKVIGRTVSFELGHKQIQQVLFAFVSSNSALLAILKRVYKHFERFGLPSFGVRSTSNLRQLQKMLYFLEDLSAEYSKELLANPAKTGALLFAVLEQLPGADETFDVARVGLLDSECRKLIEHWIETGTLESKYLRLSTGNWPRSQLQEVIGLDCSYAYLWGSMSLYNKVFKKLFWQLERGDNFSFNGLRDILNNLLYGPREAHVQLISKEHYLRHLEGFITAFKKYVTDFVLSRDDTNHDFKQKHHLNRNHTFEHVAKNGISINAIQYIISLNDRNYWQTFLNEEAKHLLQDYYDFCAENFIGD